MLIFRFERRWCKLLIVGEKRKGYLGFRGLVVAFCRRYRGRVNGVGYVYAVVMGREGYRFTGFVVLYF